MGSLTIGGKQYTLSTPYAAGTHELTEAEAHTLNQVRHDRIRNVFLPKIKKGAEDTDWQEAISAHDAKFAFGTRQRGPGRGKDPVEAEALSLAEAAIRAVLKQNGQKASFKTVNASAKQLLADAEAGARFRATATERVAERQNQAQLAASYLGVAAPAA